MVVIIGGVRTGWPSRACPGWPLLNILRAQQHDHGGHELAVHRLRAVSLRANDVAPASIDRRTAPVSSGERSLMSTTTFHHVRLARLQRRDARLRPPRRCRRAMPRVCSHSARRRSTSCCAPASWICFQTARHAASSWARSTIMSSAGLAPASGGRWQQIRAPAASGPEGGVRKTQRPGVSAAGSKLETLSGVEPGRSSKNRQLIKPTGGGAP